MRPDPQNRPRYWFRPITDIYELSAEPEHIEYLKMWTGETFIHTGGTAYWIHTIDHPGYLDVQGCMQSGITHWRLPDPKLTEP